MQAWSYKIYISFMVQVSAQSDQIEIENKGIVLNLYNLFL